MSSEQHDIIVCNSWDWNIDNPFNPQYITDTLEHMFQLYMHIYVCAVIVYYVSSKCTIDENQMISKNVKSTMNFFLFNLIYLGMLSELNEMNINGSSREDLDFLEANFN